ncbi:hypothetical protein VT06_11545 [Arsukibacterium sp. MJ3]|nr:hypothetical protein VT06_11545 [Arsukibacterium sp. MJ3]
MQQAEHYTLVPETASPYLPSVFPDRIIMLPTSTPQHSQTVNWRTSHAMPIAMAEIALASAGPGFAIDARQARGETSPTLTENGAAMHHRVTFTELKSDTLYTYRVQGAGTWSEWLQFRTTSTELKPFSFIYFGDAQNHVKAHVSRVMREAFMQRPRASLMLHAGDLVNSRAGNHDNEWGEWFAASGWQASMINQFITPGNHEYIEQDGDVRTLVPQFSAQFSALKNGPQPLQDTVYFTDYQGVRFISLNSMEALQNEALAKLQADWLQQVLENNPSRWTVVTYHHPMFSVSSGRDNARLRQYWQPLLERFQVDLVLQGHDHVYGRLENISSGLGAASPNNGPVYVVSVTGPKMYLTSAESRANMDHSAEDTQLFQLIDVEQDKLIYQALTPNGELYDAFELHKDSLGNKQLVLAQPLPQQRLCTTPEAERFRASRCWNGTEFNINRAIVNDAFEHKAK